VPVHQWDQRFFESTKGRILALLRRGERTVEELAGELRVSDNAIRPHLVALERDGLVQQRGARSTGGKPATVYQVVTEAEQLFTRAYVPVLTQLVGVLAEQMKPAALEKLLREVGKRLAAARGPVSGDLRTRAETAAAVLTDLGGIVDVEEKNGSLHLQGFSCPLADAVRAYPGTCRAVETLVAQVVGRSVREHCDRGERPRCCFEVLAERPVKRSAGRPRRSA
jgi:predicted ArsR family transcriptional regulator